MNNITMCITNNLYFNMFWFINIFFYIYFIITKSCFCF